MTLVWYITLYTKSRSRCTLDSYEKCNSYEQAQRKLRTYKPEYPTQFYRVEYEEVLGELASVPKVEAPKRTEYSNNKVKAAFQKDADKMIDDILDKIKHLKPNASKDDIKCILEDFKFYKKMWTKEQRETLMLALAEHPCCTAFIYEYNSTHHNSYYI